MDSAPSGMSAEENETLLQPSDGETNFKEDSVAVDRAIRGFYVYSWAIEVYAAVCLTLFLPIALEQYAREAGSLASDHFTPCDADPTAPCQVRLLGMWMNTASFSLYTYSISVALQALTVIGISSLANNATHRRMLLLMFTIIGGVSCILFIAVPSESLFWPLASTLALSGNVAFGASMVCLNAMLPIIAAGRLRLDEKMGDTRAGLYEDDKALRASRLSKLTSAISSKGIAVGYAGGVILLLGLLAPVTLMKGSLFSLRLAILASGLWWLLFSIPAFFWLGLPSTRSLSLDEAPSWSEPWTSLFTTLKSYKRIPETFKYLLAWFIMSDAFATITSTAVLFAKNTLGMSASSLIAVGVLSPVFGILGALMWPIIQERCLKTSNLATLVIIVALAVLIPIYGLVALTTQIELLLLSCYFGALYGAFQAYSRTVYASLIPPRKEARFFALYSITDKSSSFIGPAVVGAIADATGSIRAGFIFLLVALILPIPVLACINPQKGAEDAQATSLHQALEDQDD